MTIKRFFQSESVIVICILMTSICFLVVADKNGWLQKTNAQKIRLKENQIDCPKCNDKGIIEVEEEETTGKER